MNKIHVYENVNELAYDVAEVLLKLSLTGVEKHVALSGGSTPLLLFKILTEEPFNNKMHWGNLHFWWVDERCVPAESEESNYGNFKRILAEKVGLYPSNVHQVNGHIDGASEVHSYSALISDSVPQNKGLPCFDLTILGMGDDGHTASLFPNNEHIIESNFTALVKHPQSGQQRVTLTMPVINNSRYVIFVVTGKNKAQVLDDVLNNKKSEFPAAKVVTNSGKLEWYIDEAAFGKKEQ